MSRPFLLAIALLIIGPSPRLFAQAHVIMTPELADATRRFTTYAPFPQYSASTRGPGLQGSGKVLLHVRSDGTVSRVDVVQSTGHRELDDACITAFSQWRFRKDYAARVHKVKIPVTFANPKRT